MGSRAVSSKFEERFPSALADYGGSELAIQA